MIYIYKNNKIISMMFGKTMIKNKKYILLAIIKDDKYHCGIYSNNGINESITDIDTGSIFYNIRDFSNSILKTDTNNELKECLYYNENKKRWRSVKYILKKN